MVQNHLLQLACLVAMEPPASLDPDAVRTEKLKVLKALRPITAANVSQDVVRGQYQSGAVGGSPVPGYADEIGSDTGTETFVAIRAQLENWRWAGVPFYMRTGKRMGSRRSEIIVQFKPVPHDVVGAVDGVLHPNRLVIRLQPDEGIQLRLNIKDPGPGGMRIVSAPLDMSFAEGLGRSIRMPDAYERLLMDVVRGDQTLFMRGDEVEAAWAWIDPLVNAWAESETPLQPYDPGSAGPDDALGLMHRDGRRWRAINV